jgi:hypothetical protein
MSIPPEIASRMDVWMENVFEDAATEIEMNI